jgi:GNAT superfamily N-acetyltransferase
VVQRVLEADPIWAAYAIADLQPEMAPNCRWLAATSADGDALALIYRGLEPPILLTAGEPALLAQLLAQEPLPPAVYASIREEHRPAVTRHYDLNGDIRPMWRMVLVDPQAALDHADGATTPPVRLAGTAAPAVLRLLAHGGPFSPDAFSPAQIDQGVFFGIYDTANRDGGVQPSAELLAVGGTHIVYHAAGIAAIGNMYTRPDQRRRGHSAAVLRAIVRELLRQGMTTIVLNVDQRNRSAQPLYLKHGFVVHIPYLEGKGSRHA